MRNNQLSLNSIPMLQIEEKKSVLYYFFSFFLLYISVYGTISIFVDNILIRSLKDIFLLMFVIVYGMKYFPKRSEYHSLYYVYLSLFLISFLGFLSFMDLTSLVYGIKITLLPIGMFFVGIALSEKRINIKNYLIVIYFLLISVWLIQYYLGIDKLMELGFVYGINIKNFYEGLLRLPSTVGTPDNYAIFLAIIGSLIHSFTKGKNRIFFFISTTFFVTVSTHRSAIVFWLTYLLVIMVIKIGKSMSLKKKMYVAIAFLCISIISIMLPYLSSTSLASTNSLEDRISHWFIGLQPILSTEGLVGNGIGTVGAASKRAAVLGLEENPYAVDNQYLALYLQMGILGLVYFLLLMGLFYLKMRSLQNYTGVALLVAALITGLFVNIIEMYPFNIILWTLVGASITKNKSII